jgi:hypothetical protein
VRQSIDRNDFGHLTEARRLTVQPVTKVFRITRRESTTSDLQTETAREFVADSRETRDPLTCRSATLPSTPPRFGPQQQDHGGVPRRLGKLLSKLGIESVAVRLDHCCVGQCFEKREKRRISSLSRRLQLDEAESAVVEQTQQVQFPDPIRLRCLEGHLIIDEMKPKASRL